MFIGLRIFLSSQSHGIVLAKYVSFFCWAIFFIVFVFHDNVSYSVDYVDPKLTEVWLLLPPF